MRPSESSVLKSLNSSLSGSLDDYIIHTIISESGSQVTVQAKKPYQEHYRSVEERLQTIESVFLRSEIYTSLLLSKFTIVCKSYSSAADSDPNYPIYH